MVFVVLCGATAFLLLLIYRKLTKMMEDESATGITSMIEQA